MRKIKDPTLFQSIRKFLTEDMPVVRKKSANTVDAYRYTLNLFLVFLREKHNKLLCSVTARDFCQHNVLDGLHRCDYDVFCQLCICLCCGE